jgi:SagB-type dehydrogenase family enzyme
VYGDGPGLDDPAELCHEAAKLHPATAPAGIGPMSLLEARPELQATIERAVRRRRSTAPLELPAPALPAIPLEHALRVRASRRLFGPAPIDLAEVGTIAWAAYGIARTSPLGSRRTVPSGGALYPLEVYFLARSVRGLESAVYHYDPPRHVLCRIADAPAGGELELLTPFPELIVPAALVLLVTAVFWRSRFKYGLRGYRFSLLEAGHLGQNALLAASSLGLSAVPLGGVYEGRVERLLGVNGVDESLVYALAFGRSVEP